MDLYWTRISCHFRSPFDSKLFRIYGGDDGARTRDLCRDRSRKLLNLNNFMSADGKIEHPRARINTGEIAQPPFRLPTKHPVFSRSKCVADLCPKIN